jgi:protein SCO1/2
MNHTSSSRLSQSRLLLTAALLCALTASAVAADADPHAAHRAAAAAALAADPHAGHQMAASGSAAAADPHAAHRAAANAQMRSEHDYKLPALKVTRADGKRLALADAIDDGRPVLLNFIYTSCTAICPITSQVFLELRERLSTAQRDAVNMISISIDPEQDTPARLTDYAKRYGSAGVWSHYTSSSADAIEIQRAFETWRGDKMNHQPTTFLRAAPGKPWVRLDGFYTPAALFGEYQKLSSATAPVADPCRDGAANSKSSATNAAKSVSTLKCKS